MERGDESWVWRLVAEKATVVGCRNRVAKRRGSRAAMVMALLGTS